MEAVAESRVSPEMSTITTTNGHRNQENFAKTVFGAEQVVEEAKTCGRILVVLSWIVVVLTMPFSLFVCFKVVQEYERAVIFRLGRLLSGGAKGPGKKFISKLIIFVINLK
nr:band 7 protein AGAP004871-like [Onthophagus taurus]